MWLGDLWVKYICILLIYYVSEQKTNASYLLTSNQRNKKIIPRGVTLTCHLYKRKVVVVDEAGESTVGFG